MDVFFFTVRGTRVRRLIAVEIGGLFFARREAYRSRCAFFLLAKLNEDINVFDGS